MAMTTDLNEADRADQARAEQAKRDSLNRDYHETFTTAAGTRVIEDMRKSAFYFKTVIERDLSSRVDEAATCRNEGARAFMLAIDERIRRGLAGRLTRDVSATPSVGKE